MLQRSNTDSPPPYSSQSRPTPGPPVQPVFDIAPMPITPTSSLSRQRRQRARWSCPAQVSDQASVEFPLDLERKVSLGSHRGYLPSPFEKAPKTKVRNFREGVSEGAKCAWAEMREGVKAPILSTCDGMRQSGVFGAVGGLLAGTTAPLAASIVFINHSSRGVIRGRRYSANGFIDPFTLERDEAARASFAADLKASRVYSCHPTPSQYRSIEEWATETARAQAGEVEMGGWEEDELSPGEWGGRWAPERYTDERSRALYMVYA